MGKYRFWTKGLIKNTCFTEEQIKKSSVRRLLLQAMMLLDKKYTADFVIKDFSKNSLSRYEKRLRKNFTDKQENLLCSAIQYLTDAFPEKEIPVKKKDIPFVIYLADEAEDAGIRPEQFAEQLVFFMEKDETFRVCRDCKSGDLKKLKKSETFCEKRLSLI